MRSLRRLVDRPRSAWGRLVEPRADGMPRFRVLLSFPVLLVLAGIVLVGLGLNGTSSGILRDGLEAGPDPQLVSGEPQPIRSDEYNVQIVWVISQIEQGLPVRNEAFPGGMDATVQNDLPSTDWSTAFRPHLVPFFFLPADQAVAARWWIPGLALMAAAFAFAVTMMPRRPVTAALLSVALFYSPFFQWWYLPITFWPVVWALTVMTALVWCFRSRSRFRWVLAGASGYLTATMAMGIYVPFIVPCVYVVAAVAVGHLFFGGDRSGPLGRRLLANVRRAVPVLVGGAAGGVVAVVWVATRLETVRALLGTVYPGQRSEATGSMGYPNVVGALGAPFSRALEDNVTAGLGANSSETSTFFLMGLLALGTLVWFLVRSWRDDRTLDPVAVGVLAAVVLLGAFALVPGWDGLAKVLQLDRVKIDRIRIALGLSSFVVPLAIARQADRTTRRPPFAYSLLAAVAAAGATAVVYASIRTVDQPTLAAAADWKWLALGTVVAAALFARPWMFVGSLVTALVVVPVGSAVNPVYRGVYDLNETTVGQAVNDVEDADPGTWVGVGTRYVADFLIEAGVEGYNGVQTSPPEEMWESIDPSGRYEDRWNRLANVSWVPGDGEPTISNPASDQIQLTFDSCSTFAGEHVEHVLSDAPLEQACLVEDRAVTVADGGTFYLYSVQPAG